MSRYRFDHVSYRGVWFTDTYSGIKVRVCLAPGKAFGSEGYEYFSPDGHSKGSWPNMPDHFREELEWQMTDEGKAARLAAEIEKRYKGGPQG